MGINPVTNHSILNQAPVVLRDETPTGGISSSDNRSLTSSVACTSVAHSNQVSSQILVGVRDETPCTSNVSITSYANKSLSTRRNLFPTNEQSGGKNLQNQVPLGHDY